MGNEKLFLVNGSNVRLLGFLHNARDAVRVLFSNAGGLELALVKRVLVLELGAHHVLLLSLRFFF